MFHFITHVIIYVKIGIKDSGFDDFLVVKRCMRKIKGLLINGCLISLKFVFRSTWQLNPDR